MTMTRSSCLQIFPGATWTASNGRHIQAHGGGIIKIGSTYWWHGEDKTGGSEFQNINCYSSKDLVQWQYEGTCLTRQDSGDLGPNRLVERPKVIYNRLTNQYIMLLHIDSLEYTDAKVGVATCAAVNGKFQYHQSFRPMGFESRDIGVFVDEDDKAYLLSEDRPNGLRIFELSADYQSVSRLAHVFPEHLESPAMIKRNEIYYIFASQLTFWFANDNLYTTSESLSGPWEPWGLFARPGFGTYDSQVTFVLPVGDLVLYLGDRWEYPGLPRSTYVWLPLNIDGRDVNMANAQSFVLDVEAWEPQEPIESDVHLPEGDHPQGVNVNGELGIPAKFAFRTTWDMESMTIAIQYSTTTQEEQSAVVCINEGMAQVVSFLPSRNPEKVAITSVHITVKVPAGINHLRVTGRGTGSPLFVRRVITIAT